MGNPVVHFEISGRDGEKLSKFYSSLYRNVKNIERLKLDFTIN